MIKYRALLISFAILLFGGPALAQPSNGQRSATPVPISPTMMNDIRFTMGTLMNDPVIVKRMNQLMSGNAQFKQHFEQMRGLMASRGWMMNGSGRMMNGYDGMMDGGRGGYGSMMYATPAPKP